MRWYGSERGPRRNHIRENEGGLSVMQEGRRLQAFQLDAYHKGSEMKQAHVQACCVLQGTELLALSGDYAHLLLFMEQQHAWEMTDLHERAGLRMWAFRQGYEGTLPEDAQELSRMPVLVMPRRTGKRRTKNRLSRSHST
jgi:hypothetical protein